MGIKVSKVKMPSTKDIDNAFNDAGKAIEKTAKDALKKLGL